MTRTHKLSRRERQIMDILYRLEQASARDIKDCLEDELSDSSVRTFLRKLEEKGHVRHREDGLKYVYFPVVEHEEASQSALAAVMKTYFSNSPLRTVNSLLDISLEELSDEEFKALEKLIRDKKKASNRD